MEEATSRSGVPRRRRLFSPAKVIAACTPACSLGKKEGEAGTGIPDTSWLKEDESMMIRVRGKRDPSDLPAYGW